MAQTVPDVTRAVAEGVASIPPEVFNRGPSFVKQYAEEKLHEAMNQPVYIAVIGLSGVGKSTFINTVRQLKPGDENAARVGVTQMTRTPKDYKDPRHPNITYCDLPGVGTPDFPQDDTYLEKINFKRYDHFIIASATRFLDSDVWLAKKIERAGKKFFFVRGKIDLDIKEERKNYQRREEEVLQMVRDDNINQLREAGFPNAQVFLICNKKDHKWNFPLLYEKIIFESEGAKRDALVWSFRATSARLLEEKRRVLASRITWASLLSALGGAIPCPEISTLVDSSLIYLEYKTYKAELNLDDKSLDLLSLKASEVDRFKLKNLRKEKIMCLASPHGVLVVMKSWSVSLLAEEISKFVPLIGTILASGISFCTTTAILNDILNQLANISQQVFEIAVKV